jgi:hypothetical protein
MVAECTRSDDPTRQALLRAREKISERLKQVETGCLKKRQDGVVNRFRALADKHDYEAIIAEGHRYPDDPAVLLYVGMAHHFLGHFSDAHTSYWESLYRRADLREVSMVLVCLGSLLEDEMRYEEAVNLWRTASHCDPENHMPYLNLMQRFCRTGEMGLVCEEAKKLVSTLKGISDPERRLHVDAVVCSILEKKEQLEPFRASSDPEVAACRKSLFQQIQH